LSETASDNPKASVPWNALLGQEEVYVEGQYLPPDFTFKEPSKLSKPEAYDRLKFWYDRQQNGDITLKFHRYRGHGGDAVAVGLSAKSKKPTRRKQLRKRKHPARGRNHSVGSDEDDDPTPPSGSPSQSDEDNEDDEENDLAPAGEEQAEQDGADEDDEAQEMIRIPTRKGVKEVAKLPFSAVPAKRNIGAPVLKAKGRYVPSTGPQFERPVTRHRGQVVEVEDREEGPSRKKQKINPAVNKVGPPIGIPQDKPEKGKPAKCNGGKGKDRAKRV
jgi:hypothetical protein